MKMNMQTKSYFFIIRLSEKDSPVTSRFNYLIDVVHTDSVEKLKARAGDYAFDLETMTLFECGGQHWFFNKELVGQINSSTVLEYNKSFLKSPFVYQEWEDALPSKEVIKPSPIHQTGIAYFFIIRLFNKDCSLIDPRNYLIDVRESLRLRDVWAKVGDYAWNTSTNELSIATSDGWKYASEDGVHLKDLTIYDASLLKNPLMYQEYMNLIAPREIEKEPSHKCWGENFSKEKEYYISIDCTDVSNIEDARNKLLAIHYVHRLNEIEGEEGDYIYNVTSPSVSRFKDGHWVCDHHYYIDLRTIKNYKCDFKDSQLYKDMSASIKRADIEDTVVVPGDSKEFTHLSDWLEESEKIIKSGRFAGRAEQFASAEGFAVGKVKVLDLDLSDSPLGEEKFYWNAEGEVIEDTNISEDKNERYLKAAKYVQEERNRVKLDEVPVDLNEPLYPAPVIHKTVDKKVELEKGETLQKGLNILIDACVLKKVDAISKIAFPKHVKNLIYKWCKYGYVETKESYELSDIEFIIRELNKPYFDRYTIKHLIKFLKRRVAYLKNLSKELNLRKSDHNYDTTKVYLSDTQFTEGILYTDYKENHWEIKTYNGADLIAMKLLIQSIKATMNQFDTQLE